MKQTSFYKTLTILLRWITIVWFRKVPNGFDHIRDFVKLVSGLESANGPIYTINYLKLIRVLIHSHLSGNPITKTTEMIIGINKSNGLPKSITFLHSLILSKDVKNLRFVFTLLSVSRLLPGLKPVDLRTITEPSKSRYSMEIEIVRYMETFLRENRWNPRFLNPLRKEDLLYSSKSGPNGEATLTALRDIHALPPELFKVLLGTNIKDLLTEYSSLLTSDRVEKLYMVQRLWKWLSLPFNVMDSPWLQKLKLSKKRKDKSLMKELINLYDRKTFNMRFDMLSLIHKGKSEWTRLKARKLSVIPDPEAKARVIAIFDYWSQNFLKQIHDQHFSFLRTLPQDRTFTQDPIVPRPPEGHKYYSFDLTAATDRFPITLQSKIIEKMFGSAVAEAWTKILIDTPFYVPWTGEYCKYASGQPMGAYSSWSTFTITHHVILGFIHDKLQLEKLYYVIIGDDIVIYHDDVAREYQEIMKELGVGIALHKSHISTNLYEFAKRVFLDGKEITGIQVRGFHPNLDKYHLIYQMMFTLVFERGYLPDVEVISIPSLIGHLFELMGKPSRQVKNLVARVRLLHSFSRFIWFDDVESFNNELKHRYPLSNFQSMPALEINNMIYLASNKAINTTTAKYIGYAERLLKSPVVYEQYALGLASESDMYTSPLWYMSQQPVVQAVANLASSLNRSRGGSIKDLISTIALPSDDVFSEQRLAVLAGAKAKLAKVTLATIEAHVIRETLANMPNPNLTSTVLSLMTSEIRALKVSKTHALIPGENQLDKPAPPAPDPYGSAPMW
jgi:hypothetical protein